MKTLFPRNALVHAQALLAEMLAIETPSEEQRRFTGALRKALGMQSNTDKWRAAKFGEKQS